MFGQFHNQYQQQPQQQPGWMEHNRRALNFLIAVVKCVSLTGEVFVRKPGTQGPMAFTVARCFWAIVLMCVFGSLWGSDALTKPECSLVPFFAFFQLFFLACLVQAVVGVIRRARGYVPRLGYNGTPLLRFRKWDEVKIKRVAEPCFVLIVGGVIGALGNLPLGFWLVTTAFCMRANVDLELHRRKWMVWVNQSAREDQQEMLEDMRRMSRTGRL